MQPVYMYFTGGYSLPNGIASEYLNCIEEVELCFSWLKETLQMWLASRCWYALDNLSCLNDVTVNSYALLFIKYFLMEDTGVGREALEILLCIELGIRTSGVDVRDDFGRKNSKMCRPHARWPAAKRV
jgi:hypothetical protein